MTKFESWWYHEGSGPPLPGEDAEEHCKRMCQIAWSNGAFVMQEACAKLVEKKAAKTWVDVDTMAAVIRKVEV
ncbi:hypothetical protein UFOVP393_63 [uncultured Caudovirales phage]|uniref:Uncharacterized protein n=1 Tax=uncultured Caudovirales phage TaxID=2100421 RepID=A0A6J7XAM3_9CAUD|nr:hypothetical protein UFOVP393_63 [uncultured Caudovirales phage]